MDAYDILVIGAGPSGSTAARYAAKAGCRTLLIEKRAEIGVPIRCGEGIAKGWLEEIGIPPSPKFIQHEVEGARVFAPDGTCLVIDSAAAGNEVGYTVDRGLFDRHLAAEAARAGAEIRIKTSAVGLLREDGRVVGARCEHMGRTFDVPADLVIGADGFESQVGRWAGLATHLKMGDVDACLEYTMVGVGGDPRYDDFYLGSCAPGGYAWVFWKGADVANVGLGVNLARVRDRGEARAYLDRFIAARPDLGRGQVLQEIAGAVSVSPPLERTVADGIVLVGDAARMIDPVTGGGILNGCLAGMYAGEVAGQALEAADFSALFLERYERRWRARLEEGL
ncbi:MAG TPA: NAD(P)/FAD-dependent oxidoreductase, partial [Thermoplasmata archaeon]|nr:NAD(P)/FAD-dependent oxidoreductase [Thermoplasmata archaeon]